MIERVYTLLIYAIVFATSIFFSYIAEKNVAKNRRKSFFLASILAIVIPCVLAGMRNETVGTDTIKYVQVISRIDTYGVKYVIESSITEPGMAIIAYISSFFGRGTGVFLFLSQLAIMLPVYLLAYRNWKDNQISISVTLFTYYMLFYGVSYNIMTQSIAGVLLVLGYSYWKDRKKIKAVCLVILAILVHNSAIIGVGLIAMALFMTHTYKLKWTTKVISIVLMVVFFAFILLNWTEIFAWGIHNGILPEEYAFYVNIFSGVKTYGKTYFFTILIVHYIEKLYYIFFLALLFVNYKKRNIVSPVKKENIYKYILIISVIINWVGLIIFHTYYAYRITLLIDFFLLVTIPFMWQNTGVRKKQGTITIRQLEITLLLVSYFIIVFIRYGMHGVMPYVFR